MQINVDELDKTLPLQLAIRKAIATRNKTARGTDTKQKQGGLNALVEAGASSPGMVNFAGPCLVRIIRRGGRRLDDDNMSGGCKQLRDAIASMLGRKGDSEADGMHWEYVQEPGETETIIEIMEAE